MQMDFGSLHVAHDADRLFSTLSLRRAANLLPLLRISSALLSISSLVFPHHDLVCANTKHIRHLCLLCGSLADQ